jgi:hypothetical protein
MTAITRSKRLQLACLPFAHQPHHQHDEEVYDKRLIITLNIALFEQAGTKYVAVEARAAAPMV